MSPMVAWVAETASKFPLDNAATCTTVPLLHRDFIELNLSSETYTSAHNDSNSAELLLRWLQLFQLPNSSGRTIRQLQSKISIVMTQYRRLVKNYNARAKRNGKNQAKALENFLNSSFVWAGQIGNGRVFQTPLSRDEPPQPCKVAPSSSDELSHAPPTFAPLLPELCEGPDEPSFKTPEDLTSHLDSTALQQNQVPQPSPCAPQSCPVTPQLAPDQTYPSASSVDQSQMSIDVSSPSSVPGPPGFQASPVARPRNIFSTPDQRCPATLPHCSTPDQTCPGLDLSQSPVTSLGSAPTPPDKDPVAPTLRCGKHRPSPDAYVLQQKLLKANRKNDRLFKENTTLQNLVGVRCRDAVKQVEKEKVDAVAEVRKELTKEIKRTSGELKAAVSRSTKLEKENVALRAQCIEFMDVAEEKEKEANKFVKYGKKVAREKHNLQKKVLRKDVKVQGLLQNFETDANIADKLHAEIVAKLKKENEDLNCRLKQLQALETKQGKRYNAEIRLVYYDLLTKGVSCNIIESVVRRVLETLSGQDVKGTALPSRSTAQRMKVEAGYLVKLRLAWEWKQRADRSAVFQTDKTTKGQLEWLSIVVKLRPNDNEDSTFTLCLEPVSSGTSECTLGTFRKCLDQLCDIAIKHNIATYDEAKRIYSISNIVGHMSDRAATETKLTRILIEEKANLLREEGLSVEEAQRRAKVYNFTCSLHKINNTAVAMTQAAEKHLQFDNETTGTRHIYQTDKLICTESNKEYAQGVRFRSFCLSEDRLQESGSTMFKPIVGGRYLVYCENAIATYCCKDLVMLFLQDLKEVKRLNRLESNVYNGFLDNKILTEVRALAIIFHDILNPLFVKALKAATPLALNDDYHFAVEKMEMFAVDAVPLLKGTDPCIEDRHHPCKFDVYMEKIREEDLETDEQVLSLLKVMCAAGAEKLRKHAEEHLPGGEYYWDDFNPRLAKAASIVGDSTNNAVEGRFASVDNQMNRCRRSNPLSVGGNVSAKHDHIVDFLDNQDKDAQEELCLSAMKGGREMALKKGTKNQQLKRLYEEGEPARQAKRRKAQERKKKAEDKRKATQQALANGELVQDAGKLDATLSVSDLKKQCQLWQSVGANATVQQVDLLKGYYKKSKPQLLAILREVVEHNSHLDMIPHQSDGESEAESSSSDEDDLALA
ncbi:uncharacterized protein [Amphiura filiformis]|uniref:uncharacterized protein n=1 Tax=Amphiura filiformis TaxID=82378 RepID=UPI003B20E26F